MKRNIVVAALFVLVGVKSLFAVNAVSLGGEAVGRTDGDDRYMIAVSVGSGTAISPFFNSTLQLDPDTIKKIRSVLIMNSGTYDLLISSIPNFTAASPYFVVPKTSGSWNTNNSATFYMLIAPEGSTITVRGNIEKVK